MGKVKEGAVSKPGKVTIQNVSGTTPVTFTSIVANGDFAIVERLRRNAQTKGPMQGDGAVHADRARRALRHPDHWE